MSDVLLEVQLNFINKIFMFHFNGITFFLGFVLTVNFIFQIFVNQIATETLYGRR